MIGMGMPRSQRRMGMMFSKIGFTRIGLRPWQGFAFHTSQPERSMDGRVH